jgi:hypothetical protein
MFRGGPYGDACLPPVVLLPGTGTGVETPESMRAWERERSRLDDGDDDDTGDVTLKLLNPAVNSSTTSGVKSFVIAYSRRLGGAGDFSAFTFLRGLVVEERELLAAAAAAAVMRVEGRIAGLRC